MGRSLTNNLSLSYAIESALGSLSAAVAASGYIDFTANPSDTEVVTLNGQAYAFETGALANAFEVDVGASLTESLDNLVAAVNLGSGSGTAYEATTTLHPTIRAYRGPNNRVYFVAKTAGTAGNALTLTTDVTGATPSGAVLAGGAAAAEGGVSTWKLLEPNTIGAFGAQITTVARAPISKNRQRRKGTVTDLDSTADFEADATIDAFEDFFEGFVMARAVHYDLVFRGAHVQNGGYQLTTPLTASQVARLQSASGVITLLKARGYAQAANNGLKALSTAVIAGDVSLKASGLAAEAAPTNAVAELAGLRTDDVTWTWDTPTGYATLTSAADIADWTVFLTPGQFVHFGSPDANGDLQNAFTTAGVYGYARVRSIDGGSVIFDKLSETLKTSGGVATTTDVMFGRFIRNVDVDHADYLERSFQMEAAYANLQDPGPGDEYEYSKGNYANELSFELPLTDKATISCGFVGTDTDVPTTVRKTGAASPRQPSGTSAFNTSADIGRLRIQELDEDGLTTDFKSITLTLNNQASPEKVLGVLGARFINTGNFLVDLESQLLFTNSGVVRAIRNNEALQLDFILKNDDQAIAVDIPRLTLGDGSKDFPVNESILINTTAEAYGDPAAEVKTSIGISFLPAVPSA